MKARTLIDLFRPNPLEIAGALPLVGESHPLRIRQSRRLARGVLLAAMIHLTIVTLWTLPRSAEMQAIVDLDQDVVHFQPPPIAPAMTRAEPIPERFEILKKIIGRPVPVEDFEALEMTIGTQEEIDWVIGTPGIDDLDRFPDDAFGYVPPARPAEETPGPGDFVAFESAPVLITLPAPVYPELARKADVEGTVVVRALIGTDGTVVDALVVEGVPMLDAAALDAVRKARFKPALQQHRPVAVWVSIPIRFRLR